MREKNTKENANQKKNHKKMIAKKGLKDTKDETFRLEDEIVIGLNLVDEKNIKVTDKQKRTKKGKKKTQKQNASKKKKQIRTPEKKISPKQYLEQEEKKKKKRKIWARILKIFFLLAILIGIILFASLSPIFSIAEITVQNNQLISSDTVISLSGIQKGENLFRFSKKEARKGVKENPYIEDVIITRVIPNKVRIEIEERTPSFQLEFANSYVYMNNQGYLLEISTEKGNYPIIIGYLTKEEDIVAGNRICTEDLERLEDVLKIVRAAKSYQLFDRITKINIEDKNNYQLILEEDEKTIHLGTATQLDTKMPNIQMVLEKEAGVPGEYFLNIDLNNQDPYFREKV